MGGGYRDDDMDRYITGNYGQDNLDDDDDDDEDDLLIEEEE